jgi:hypothetical protein
MRISLAALAAGLAVATSNPGAELIAACEAVLAADAYVFGPDISQEDLDAAWPEYYEPLEKLTALPAATDAGRKKAVAAYRAIASAGCLGREEEAALSALADFVGVAAWARR